MPKPTEEQARVLVISMLDQDWRKAEGWITEFTLLSQLPTMDLAVLMLKDPDIAKLVKRACLIVATQAAENIELRKASDEG